LLLGGWSRPCSSRVARTTPTTRGSSARRRNRPHHRSAGAAAAGGAGTGRPRGHSGSAGRGAPVLFLASPRPPHRGGPPLSTAGTPPS